MSILNRLTGRHLDDATLAELWTASAGGSRDVITDSHLQQCAECRVRFSAFASWMDGIRDDAVSEADAAFTSERLAAQQAQIFKRLEAAERPARVIAFPRFSGAQMMTRQSTVHRWILASAAAGLMVGIGLGQLMDLRHPGGAGDSRISAPASDSVARGTTKPATAPVSAEALFQELDAAATPQYDALRPFDTFTPRAADFITSSR